MKITDKQLKLLVRRVLKEEGGVSSEGLLDDFVSILELVSQKTMELNPNNHELNKVLPELISVMEQVDKKLEMVIDLGKKPKL